MAYTGDVLANQNTVLQIGGTNLEWTDMNGQTRTIRGIISMFGRDDGALINAYGAEARVIQFGNINPWPQKFDRILEPVTQTVYTVEDIHNIVMDGVLIAHRAVVKA